MTALLLVNLLATWAMVGVIWTVQVVHYPLMAYTGPLQSAGYQRRHVKQISILVVPIMTIEAVAAIALFFAQPEMLTLSALVLLTGIWAITAALSFPAHDQLQNGYGREPHERLMRSNFARTVLWTARGCLVAALAVLP